MGQSSFLSFHGKTRGLRRFNSLPPLIHENAERHSRRAASANLHTVLQRRTTAPETMARGTCVLLLVGVISDTLVSVCKGRTRKLYCYHAFASAQKTNQAGFMFLQVAALGQTTQQLNLRVSPCCATLPHYSPYTRLASTASRDAGCPSSRVILLYSPPRAIQI